MTQEDKEFLLVDLSARLPYGVVLHIESEITIDSKFNAISLPPFNHPCEADLCDGICGLNWEHIQLVKPYLRPLSSMTEEEKKEYKHLIAFSGSPEGAANLVDWLNKKMFAYRTIDGKDMFELGLAWEAPEGMYKNK